MKPGQPSRTAEYMAFFRACESVRPEGRRLFVDPFAAHFVRPSLRAAAWLSRIRLLGGVVDWIADRRLPGARTSAIARTRLIDEALSRALRENLRQIVILGAGFDCRAYRLPGIQAAEVFEVDHPCTLAWKLARLRQALATVPGNVRFVEMDFDRQSLPRMLAEAGFDSALPAMFLWEGVTNYLSFGAVDSVLRYVSSCPAGSQLIFTYVHAGVLDGSVHFDGGAEIVRDVAHLGEPWTFGLDPAAVPEFLRERGLLLDRDAGAREYRSQYYGTAGRNMKGYDFYHVVLAHVPANESSTACASAQESGTRGRLHA